MIHILYDLALSISILKPSAAYHEWMFIFQIRHFCKSYSICIWYKAILGYFYIIYPIINLEDICLSCHVGILYG